MLPTVSDYLDETEVNGEIQLSEKPDAAAHIEELQQIASRCGRKRSAARGGRLKVHFPERAGFFSGQPAW